MSLLISPNFYLYLQDFSNLFSASLTPCFLSVFLHLLLDEALWEKRRIFFTLFSVSLDNKRPYICWLDYRTSFFERASVLLPPLLSSADLQGFEQLGHSASSCFMAFSLPVFSNDLLMSLLSLIAAPFLTSSHFYSRLTFNFNYRLFLAFSQTF